MRTSHSVGLGMAVGAGIAYFLDHDTGARRRSLVRGKVVHAGHEVADGVQVRARDVRNRATGVVSRVRAGLRDDTVDDVVLEERVRSRVGHATSHPGFVDVHAEQGRVTLSGDVPADEGMRIVHAVERVRGVESIDNRFEVRERGDDNRHMQRQS